MMSGDSGSAKRRRALPFVGSLALVLVFILAACGTNTTTGAPAGSGAATPSPTATQGQASANGCPSGAVVTTPQTQAGLVLTSKNSGSTVTVSKGETIEVDLPLGHSWSGPANLSPNLLAMQTPAGYESSTAKACVWRFTATGTGVAHLAFAGRAICKKGQACPMYVMAVNFTLDIK